MSVPRYPRLPRACLTLVPALLRHQPGSVPSIVHARPLVLPCSLGSDTLHFKSPSAVKSPRQNVRPGAPKKPATPATLRLRHVMSARLRINLRERPPNPMPPSMHWLLPSKRPQVPSEPGTVPEARRVHCGLGSKRDARNWSPAEIQFAQQKLELDWIYDPREQPWQQQHATAVDRTAEMRCLACFISLCTVRAMEPVSTSIKRLCSFESRNGTCALRHSTHISSREYST